MKKLFKHTILFLLLVVVGSDIQAVPAYPYPVKITQPDGTTLTIRLKGDEFHHYTETEDGYMVTKNSMGIFNYATRDINGKIIETQVKANNVTSRSNSEKLFVSGLELNVPNVEFYQQMRARRAQPSAVSTQKRVYPSTGTPRSLVILVNFSDLSYVTPNPKEAFTALLNEQGYSANGGTGSARDYFIDNSMSKFSPQFDVVGPYTLPKALKYYGDNINDQDINSVQMVVDACKVADEAGVDFSDYDVDNDGLVDNVFIYYAGHNEAEHAYSSTIWPHRWGIYPTSMYNGGNYSGTVSSVTFDGKRVEDYACTSELKGNSGTSMAGIGTFTHEFGHVIGLADMYATNGENHHTLSNWNIMDGGAYLNSGRTPPAYNTFERFQLGFVTPIQLINPADIILNPLTTHNEAYLISSTETHNLSASNPSPTQFFLLENRQKIGWDTYLPGHGMLIYRIYYNRNDWNYNQPNNDPSKMGVDIIEADGIPSGSTLAGDPFPGTSNVKSYIPALRSGTKLDKPITSITETDKIITFKFKGGKDVPILTADSKFTGFNTVQSTPSDYQTFRVSGIRLKSDIVISFVTNNHFQVKKLTDPETSWSKSVSLSPVDSVVELTDILVRYNPTEPSFKFTHSDILTISTTNLDPVTINLSGQSTRPIYVVPPVATEAADITYKSVVAKWNPVFDATGYYLTVTQADENGMMTPLINDKWVTSTTDTLYYLISDRDYAYKVKASDKNTEHEYENITEYSNTISVHTLPYPFDKELRVVVNKGNVKVFVPSKEVSVTAPIENETIHVFNTLGQKVKSYRAESDILDISDLPKGIIFIIQAGKYRTKVIL